MTSAPPHSHASRDFSVRFSGHKRFTFVVLYGIVFALLHRAAQPWAGAAFFSLWYPAAGLRFAVLWYGGAQLTPWLMAIEVAADVATGTLVMDDPTLIGDAFGVLRPAFSCGLAIASVRWMGQRGSGPMTLAPMPFGVAALAGPILNALLIVPMEMVLPTSALPALITTDTVVSLTGLAVGDLLGVLVLAPSLLWIAGVLDRSTSPHVALPSLRPLLEDASVMAACLMLTTKLWQAGLGAQPLPTLLAGAWIGLRHGRTAAWFAILAEVVVFLPHSAGGMDDGTRLDLHLGIAAVVLVTWLAGSFADAQATARSVLERRNRLLFQAERLKTLRAMSVAVIHEISQPLSTLAIEAAHLRKASSDLAPDIIESIELVDRKARTLAELVRQLRRFGGRDTDEPTPLPVTVLLETARQVVAAELRSQQCRLEMDVPSSDIIVEAQEIELTQALVNLLRNAIAAASDRTVRLTARSSSGHVEIEVANNLAPATQGSGGMGVGLIIARTIVEAHGGTLVRADEPDVVQFLIPLPLAGSPI